MLLLSALPRAVCRPDSLGRVIEGEMGGKGVESPHDLVEIVRSDAENLEQFLVSLPAAAWSQPTACDKWVVRDVVAHLVSGVTLMLRRSYRPHKMMSLPCKGGLRPAHWTRRR